MFKKTYADGCVVTMDDEIGSLTNHGLTVIDQYADRSTQEPEAYCDSLHFNNCCLVEGAEAEARWQTYLASLS